MDSIRMVIAEEFALRALALDAYATDGPWYYQLDSIEDDASNQDAKVGDEYWAICDQSGSVLFDEPGAHQRYRRANGNLIAAYRNEVPMLAKAYLELAREYVLLQVQVRAQPQV